MCWYKGFLLLLLPRLFYFSNTTLSTLLFAEPLCQPRLMQLDYPPPQPLPPPPESGINWETCRERERERHANSEADTQREAEVPIPEVFTSGGQSQWVPAVVPCLGFCKLPHILPKSPLLLKQIGLGFLLIPSEITFPEILAIAFMMKSRFLDTVTKICRIWCLLTPPSLNLNTLTSYFIFQSYLELLFSFLKLFLLFRIWACCFLPSCNTLFSLLSGQFLFGLPRYTAASPESQSTFNSPSTYIRQHNCLLTCLSSSLDFELSQSKDWASIAVL